MPATAGEDPERQQPATATETCWGPDDPRNPYNWPTSRKLTIALIITLGHLVGLMSVSIVAPALGRIAKDLRMSESVMQIAFSVYTLGLAFGPFIIGPLSLAIASLLPYLGPALGPIVGGLVSQHLRWQLLFWIMSAASAVITVLGFLLLRETNGKILLQRISRTASSSTSPPQPFKMVYLRNVLRPIQIALLRPLKLLRHRPIVIFLSLNIALNFSIYFLVLSAFAQMWIDRGQTPTESSLNYIAIAAGAIIGTQTGGPLMDWLWRLQRNKHKQQLTITSAGQPSSPKAAETAETAAAAAAVSEENDDEDTAVPEYHVPFLVAPTVIMPAGLLWYGWAVERGLSWPVADIGVGVFCCASFMLSQGFYAYLFDEFGAGEAASANAALYGGPLGYGWGNSLPAILFVALGFPSVVVLWYGGPRLRAVGKDGSM
ncbi:florfenicol exporter [Apiospora phragmitis]|uniref:Florfenicol exporter n=1 Tax=Apiospora phragmitis TaxID=2905665 RepID=A0ABR1TT99_9PEZI